MTQKSSKLKKADLEDDLTSEFSYANSENFNLPGRQSSHPLSHEIEQDDISEAEEESTTEEVTKSAPSSPENLVPPKLAPIVSKGAGAESGSPSLFGTVTNGLSGIFGNNEEQDQLSEMNTPTSFDLKEFHAPKGRESYMSHVSQYSGKVDRVEDLGEQAVSVKLVRHVSTKKEDKNKLVYIPSTSTTPRASNNASTSSIKSGSSSIKLGKLPTVKKATSAEDDKLSPDVSYNTNIEGSVPARSPRRPKSDLLSAVQTKELEEEIEHFHASKRNSNRNSTQLSDDLDKLMKNASSLKSGESEIEPIDMGASASEENDESKDIKQSQYIGDESIPREGKSKDEGKLAPAVMNIPSEQVKHNDDSSELHSIISNNSESIDHNISHNVEGYPSKGGAQNAEDNVLPKKRQSPSSNLPPRPSLDNVLRAREVSASIQRNQGIENSDITEATNERPKGVSTPEKELDISGNLIVTPRFPASNDDEFYDIGEPVLVHKPSRAKSVKDATKHSSQRKSKTGKTKKAKSKSSGSSDLKPFSYNTLINLLESMNGTVIGEEFSQLNLPAKEKQLIEKIIDSLSRLTSDMVIDKSRYDVGIQRLEKALRVLEGFM
ncbi:uncharacterized protein RJT20DRAFT_123950 [Scheffersomyces xylosifermentans]|uniref:uncharacterized protein n=1 Tax=Scheffersomyces xylosifermentans TaxID=1304137 RepID=UPI00315DD3CE